MAQLKLSRVRLAFPQLFEPKTVNGEGEPAFSASFLIDPKDSQVAKIKALMAEVGKAKWGAKWPTVEKELAAKDRGVLHDGDGKAEYAGFAGMLYISARNKVRPTVVDRDKAPLVAADGKPYGGCFVNVILDVWAQDNNFGKRINASLGGVQFFEDGEAFSGGGVASADDFDDVSELEAADLT